jgi:hypothetical protein
MTPIRRRDVRSSPISGPVVERRAARGLELSIDVSLANETTFPPTQPKIGTPTKTLSTDQLELALAAKELELVVCLFSPMLPGPAFSPEELTRNISQLPFPEIIDSFYSFQEMKREFLRYLVKDNLQGLIPDSKLYRSVYFPYG